MGVDEDGVAGDAIDFGLRDGSRAGVAGLLGGEGRAMERSAVVQRGRRVFIDAFPGRPWRAATWGI